MKNQLLIFVFFLAGTTLFGFQDKKSLKDNISLKTSLKGSALRKFNRSQKLIGKANLILDEAKHYEQQIEEIKQTSRRARSRKITKLERKKMTKEIEAFYAFEIAHKKIYQAYKKTLKGFREQSTNPIKGIDLEKSARLNYRRAKKLRNKAENKKSEDKVYKFLSDAYDFEIDAINYQIEAYESYKFITAIQEEQVEPELLTKAQDSISGQTDSLVIDSVIYKEPEIIKEKTPELLSEEIDTSDLEIYIADTLIIPEIEKLTLNKEITADSGKIDYLQDTVSLAKESIPEDTIEHQITLEETAGLKIESKIEPEPSASKAQQANNVYFSIQILSKTSPATPEQLRSVYNGNEEVVLKRSDNYYRYLIGQFKTLFEARIFKNNEDIEGFIVAYKNDKRITIKEATDLTKNR
jgi:hypothetical protein